MLVQKITVKIQNTDMQDVFTYHLTLDSVSIQKLRPPNTNNKIGNAIFIFYLGCGAGIPTAGGKDGGTGPAPPPIPT